MTDATSLRGAVWVDGHAHLDRGWPLGRALDHAAERVRRVATTLDRDVGPIHGMLCLVERAGDRPFATLRAIDAGSWRLEPTREATALVARRRREPDLTLCLIAGRQIRTDRGLEVLAVGIAPDDPALPPDGLALDTTLAHVVAASCPAIVPWGFGKWWGERGSLVAEQIDAARRLVFLGDTGSRPGLVAPDLFGRALRRGVRILPGSDPLPGRRGDRRLAARGFRLDGPLDLDRPATWLRHRLSDPATRPEPWGRLRPLGGAIADQVRLRLGRSPRALPRPEARPASRISTRLLMVAPQPFFSPRGTPFSVRQRIAALAALGVGVDLLTYGEGQDVGLPGLRIHRLPRLPIGPVPIGPSWRKLLLDAWLAPWTALHLLRHRRRYAAIHAHEEAVFWCRAIAPRVGLPLIYDMHSSLPDHLRVFGRSRLAVKIFERLERWSLDGADAVLTVSPELAAQVVTRLDALGRRDRHTLLENTFAVDEETVSDEVVDRLLPADRPVALYAGTFETYQGVELLIDAFAEVHAVRPDACLLLVGGTESQIEAIRRRAERLGLLAAVRLPGRLAPAIAAALARRVAVQVSPRIAGPTPLKVYAMLAAGTPIVATRVAAHASVFDDTVARLADPEPPALAAALLDALDDDGRRSAAAIERHRQRYGRDRFLTRLRHALDGLDIPTLDLASAPTAPTEAHR